MLLPGGAQNMSKPECWATYSERVIGGSGGSSSGPWWWRQHGQSCWKDAKCAEVQPGDQIGLLLGTEMEKKMRGGDQKVSACLGQPPSLVRMALVSANELCAGPVDFFPALLPGWMRSPNLNLTMASKLLFHPWEYLYILTQQMRLFPGMATSATSLLLTPHLHPANPAPLTPLGPCTLSPLWREYASPPSLLAKSYSWHGFHLNLGVPSSRKPSLTPKVSAQMPSLCSPNIPVSLK